jgi:hypothetical protein
MRCQEIGNNNNNNIFIIIVILLSTSGIGEESPGDRGGKYK